MSLIIDLRFWKFGEILGDATHNSCVQIAMKGNLKLAVKILSNISHNEYFDRNGLLEMNNSNLVSIRDVVVRQKLRYNSKPKTAILMEYCTDGDMENYITEQNDAVIEVELFLKWTKQMAEGILFLYSKNIIHGDLKTKNIFLTNDKNQSKIGDFDDRFLLKNGKIERPKGTEGWQAPETFSDVWSHKADVYSFALILWSMFTLKNPENTNDLDAEIKNTNSITMNLFLNEYATEYYEIRKNIEDFLKDFETFKTMLEDDKPMTSTSSSNLTIENESENEYEIINQNISKIKF